MLTHARISRECSRCCTVHENGKASMMVDSYTVLDARLGENQFSNCIRDPIVIVYVCVYSVYNQIAQITHCTTIS